MKVLHVTDLVGSVPFLNNLTDYTNPEEVEHSFLTLATDGAFLRDMRNRGKRTYALNARTRWRYPLVLRRLWKILQDENPDIVHTHLFNPSLIGRMVAGWQKRRVVMTRHHSVSHHELPGALKRTFYRRVEDYINRGMDHIVAPARMVRDVLVDLEHVPSEKVTVIPYGQTTERFDPVTPDRIARVQIELNLKRNLALACVGRLYPRKGHEYLFQAFADLTREGLDATLYLIGAGNYQAQLEKEVATLGLTDRVRFLGWRADVLEIVAACDVVVHPSLEEALSQVTIEAIMLGVPVVATETSGTSDTLGDGRYGKVVPRADAAALREGIREVLADLPAARERAALGRAHVLRYMNAGRVAQAYTDVYRRVLSR